MDGSRRPSDALRLSAVLWVGGVRVGLWVLPFRTVRRWVPRVAAFMPPRRGGAPSEEDVAWAVYAARRAVPRARCLVRALAAWGILRRWDRPAELHLGVGSGPFDGVFQAHAWVESEGRVVVGGDVTGQVSLGTLPGDEERD